MLFEKLVTIIPIPRMDPDAAELSERLAQATLGSYQALWHPALLSRSATVPVWTLAADPPLGGPAQLVLVPEPSRGLVADGLEERLKGAGATVIVGEEVRERFLSRIWEALPEEIGRSAVTMDAHGCFALGLARLWVDMLAAHMRHSGTLDEEHFQKEALAAASAAALGDQATREDHLRAAFQLITEARERLYPADIHLLDLCLLDPRAWLDRLGTQLSWDLPLNIFASGRCIEELSRRDPAVATKLRGLLEVSRVDLIGGEYDELASTLLPLESHLWQFRRGAQSYREVLGRTPTVFGRRRFGLARHVLQLLNRHEFLLLAQFSFDEGRFPTKAEPKVRWEAPDSSTVEALVRIPLAADKSVEFLRFPGRLAKTIASDFVATLTMAHWPAPQLPWYGELLAMHQYANVFGRFNTLSTYFQTTDAPTISSPVSSDDYSSPFLADAHRAGSHRPVSTFAQQHRLRARLEQVRCLAAVHAALSRVKADETCSELDALESQLELGDAGVESRLVAVAEAWASRLAQLICPEGSGSGRGFLMLNTLGCDRWARVPRESRVVPAPGAQPDADRPIRAEQVVYLPAFGFKWVQLDGPVEAGGAGRPVAVQGKMLRNEFIEVELDEATGGIQSIREPGGRGMRMGQQLVLVGIRPGQNYSYDPTPGLGPGEGGYGIERSKSEMTAIEWSEASSGPEWAELSVRGKLIAQPTPSWASEAGMAQFRLTYCLGRAQATLRVHVEILDITPGALDPDEGPWQSYLASRFAWPDSRCTLARAAGHLVESTASDRPESPYFLEVHGRRYRDAILSGGMPFFRRVGSRMVDLILVTATEQQRCFEFGIGINLPNPFHEAQQLVSPPLTVATTGPPPGGPTGWFFHLDARNVVITSLSPLGGGRVGVRIRLFESAGRYTRTQLRCVRDVIEARLTDFLGQRLATLESGADTVTLDMAPHEISQIEIEFA